MNFKYNIYLSTRILADFNELQRSLLDQIDLGGAPQSPGTTRMGNESSSGKFDQKISKILINKVGPFCLKSSDRICSGRTGFAGV